MTRSREAGRLGRLARVTVFLVALVAVGWAAAQAVTFLNADQRPPAQPGPVGEVPVAINLPAAIPAAQAVLPDDEPIIGITAGGRHRAYALIDLSAPARHVVNDRLGSTPYTVTYCNRLDCTRVFTRSAGSELLELSVGGFVEDVKRQGLLIRYGNTLYRQDNGEPMLPVEAAPFPYSTMAFERTTWREWREKHPDTDLYVRPPTPILR